jgi:hypothetical protein
MLYDCKNSLISLDDVIKKVSQNTETFYIYKENDNNIKYLFELDKEGKISENKFAHIKIDEGIKLANNEELKWIKIGPGDRFKNMDGSINIEKCKGSNPSTQK